MESILPISIEDLMSYACAGFVPAILTIWFITSIMLFLCSGKKERTVQKRRMIWMIVSGVLMTLCYVGMIFLYYSLSLIMQSM